MLDYMAIIKGHTANAVLQSPDMPDFRLMIGEAEDLDTIQLRIPQTTIPKSVAKSVKQLEETCDNDTLMDAINAGTLEVNDISTSIAMLANKTEVSQ